MLKVCIKHFIYDLCIDVFFNKISSNFRTTTINRLPRRGEYFSKISNKYDDESFYECVVREIEEYTNGFDKPFYLIKISFEYCNGSAFDDVDWLANKTNEEWEFTLDGYDDPNDDAVAAISHSRYNYYR